MANIQDIHAFALRWIEIFDNPETMERDTYRLGEECQEMRFRMDLAKSFREKFSEEDFLNPIAFHDIIHLIDDVNFLCCAVFSKYRLLTKWWNQDCLEPRNRQWFKCALNHLAELTDPVNYIEHFKGKAQSIRLVSNNICFGPMPAPDEEVEQHFILSDKGLGKVYRYKMVDRGNSFSEMDLCIGSEHARKILDAVGLYFSKNMPVLATDIGTWSLSIFNEEGMEFCFFGSFDEKAGLSDLIRRELGMDDLFLFDGNPDRIDHFDLSYRRSIKDVSAPAEEEPGYWYYLERLTIDRAEGCLEYTQGYGGRSSATYIFRDAEATAMLLNRINLFPEDCEIDCPDDLLDNEPLQEYRLRIQYKRTDMLELSGGYDKYGLPENWESIMDEIRSFIRTRGFIGDILNDTIYLGGRRRSSDLIFVYVQFGYSDKEYCYLADEDIYAPGDWILVPVGSGEKIKAVEVTKVEYHSEEDAPYPLDKIKKVIGKTEEMDEE